MYTAPLKKKNTHTSKHSHPSKGEKPQIKKKKKKKNKPQKTKKNPQPKNKKTTTHKTPPNHQKPKKKKKKKKKKKLTKRHERKEGPNPIDRQEDEVDPHDATPSLDQLKRNRQITVDEQRCRDDADEGRGPGYAAVVGAADDEREEDF